MTQTPSSDICELSERVDGKKHTWKFDGDDPYIVCSWCGEVRDAIQGWVITKGRTKPYKPFIAPGEQPTIYKGTFRKSRLGRNYNGKHND